MNTKTMKWYQFRPIFIVILSIACCVVFGIRDKEALDRVNSIAFGWVGGIYLWDMLQGKWLEAGRDAWEQAAKNWKITAIGWSEAYYELRDTMLSRAITTKTDTKIKN